MLAGAFQGKRADGRVYYRASITHRGKHISLGSFSTEEEAHCAYGLAGAVLKEAGTTVEDYPQDGVLSFEKWVVLHNFRDNGLYFKTPIYLLEKYFLYYYSLEEVYKFDVDDLFYYSTHKIMKRGGHLFVADFGVQENILHRYGIKNYGVAGKDYLFVNGDSMDYRYENIEVINRYHGVSLCHKKGRGTYRTKIHMNGEVMVGYYGTEQEAAVAYNKAAEFLWSLGIKREFPLNYILDMEREEYLSCYQRVRIRRKGLELAAGEYGMDRKEG